MTHLTDANFQASVSSGTILVDFSAAWCGPCRILATSLDKAADKMPEVQIVKMDIDECPETATAQLITAVPTMKLFKDGKVLWTYTGAMAADKIVESVKKALEAA